MTKSIKDIATDAFMAGRKSMELEFESKGRAIQRPIDAQIRDYTKEIEAIIREARPPTIDMPSRLKIHAEDYRQMFYDMGQNDTIKRYEANLRQALYRKGEK